jgi:restriction system protein
MIPDFQTIMLPVLTILKDGIIKAMPEIREIIIKEFYITEEEQNIMIPSGRQLLYYNRIAWAITHLKMAELIDAPERGKYLITDLGKSVIANPPEKISVKFLQTLPNYNKNRSPNKQEVPAEEQEEEIVTKTPDELIEIGYSQINNDLSNKLISLLKNATPFYFEKIVLDLLLKMGYGGSDIENGEITSKTGDEGIDGIIKEDKLGLGKIYIQAKKWENTVGRPDIQKFVGALQGKRAKKGIFITTSNFSKEALDYSNNLDISIILIDGQKLTQLMIEYELGVTVKDVFKIKKIDTDYFIEE